MEFFSLYFIANILISFFSGDIVIVVNGSLIFAAVAWLALFILQGIGLFAMAKRRGIKNKWLAFLPFGNLIYMGKIAGESRFFGHKMKNAGVYAMITQILATAVVLIYVLSWGYLICTVGVPQEDSIFSNPAWLNLTGFAAVVEEFYLYSGMLLPIVGLISQLFMLVLIIPLYKKYAPRNYFGFSFFAICFPIGGLVRFITVFILRKREAVNYDEYMRKRREEFMRRQQQYYNGYGGPNMRNPYGSQNPYGMGGYNGAYGAPQEQPKNEDPFEEFSSENTETGTGNDKETDGDDFFD